MPGSLGAQLAVPDQPVVGITGDGGFNMTIGELETARRTGTPFTLMIVNNAASGYVKALQHSLYGSYQSSDFVEMNYAEIAKDFGCHGIRVTDPEQLAPAIRSAVQERSRPSIIDVVVTRDPAKMLPGVDNRILKVTKATGPFDLRIPSRLIEADRCLPQRLPCTLRPCPVVVLAADAVVAHLGEDLARRRQISGIDPLVGIPQVGADDGAGALEIDLIHRHDDDGARRLAVDPERRPAAPHRPTHARGR